MPELPDCFIVLAKPAQGVSTAQAYHLCDTAPNLRAPDRFGMLGALLSEDLESIGRLAGNVFEQVIDVPERVRIKALMREYGTLGCCMSGSGPTVFGLFDTHQGCAELRRTSQVSCAGCIYLPPGRGRLCCHRRGNAVKLKNRRFPA